MSMTEIPCSGQLHQGALLPPTEFYKNIHSVRGYRSQCRDCQNLTKRARRKNQQHQVDVTKKSCSDCGEILPLESFYKANEATTGCRPECKSCTTARRRGKANPVKVVVVDRVRTTEEKRMLRLVRMYKISEERYYRMLKDQNGLCALCGGNNGGKPLFVDHDHSCCPAGKSCGGCVRALLCRTCNTGLGCFNDDIARLLAAAEYVSGRGGGRRC